MVAPRSYRPNTLQALMPDVCLPQLLVDQVVSGLCLDSRRVKEGDVFVAMPGLVADGRTHIEAAFDRGAVVVLAEATDFTCTDLRVVLVQGLSAQLSEIAGRFYADPSDLLRLTGITGTNGKTTVSGLLAQVVGLLEGCCGLIGTLGHGVVAGGRSELELLDTNMTTPDTITVQALLAGFVAAKVGRVSMEVSSHSLDQWRVQALTFETAVFTNLSRDHLDYHSSLVSYADAKKRLFSLPRLSSAIINIDDPVGAEIAAQLPHTVQFFGYSLLNPNAAIYADNVVLMPAGLRARIQTPWGRGELKSSLLGDFNLQNLLAVIGAACVQGFALSEVLDAIPKLNPILGRMELVSLLERRADNLPQVVVDYAHTPDALKSVLNTLRQHCVGKLWCVFGCGGDRDQGKRPEMGEIASTLADHVIVTSDNPRNENPDVILNDICSGVTTSYSELQVVPNREQAIHLAVQSASQEDIILVAGKGHETYQLVGMNRLPFSDQAQARLALRQREESEARNDH